MAEKQTKLDDWSLASFSDDEIAEANLAGLDLSLASFSVEELVELYVWLRLAFRRL